MSGLEDQSSQCQKLYIRTICISEALLQSSSSVVSQPYHTCSSKDNYALNLCFLGYKPLDGSVCHTENTTGPDTVTYPRHYKHMQVTFLFLILLLFYFFPYLYKKILIITLKKSAWKQNPQYMHWESYYINMTKNTFEKLVGFLV